MIRKELPHAHIIQSTNLPTFMLSRPVPTDRLGCLMSNSSLFYFPPTSAPSPALHFQSLPSYQITSTGHFKEAVHGIPACSNIKKQTASLNPHLPSFTFYFSSLVCSKIPWFPFSLRHFISSHSLLKWFPIRLSPSHPSRSSKQRPLVISTC